MSAIRSAFAALPLFALCFSTAMAADGPPPTGAPGSGNGECWVDYPAGRGPYMGSTYVLRLKVRAHDGNFEVDMLATEWDKAEAALSTPRPITRQMQLNFDTGMTSTSRSGGYIATDDYADSAWAAWGAGDRSDQTFAMLKDASSVQIKFDNVDFEAVPISTKGSAYEAISKCVDAMNKGP